MAALGFDVIATRGTAEVLEAAGIKVRRINKVAEGRSNIVDALKNGEIHLVFNTTEGSQALTDSMSIRRTTLMMKVPYYTTLAGAAAAAEAIKSLQAGDLDVRPLQSYA
jgi:carbamoyl-phosphate synthase large subunit